MGEPGIYHGFTSYLSLFTRYLEDLDVTTTQGGLSNEHGDLIHAS